MGGPVWPDWREQQRSKDGNKEQQWSEDGNRGNDLVNYRRQPMRQESVYSPDTSMEEEEMQEAEEVHMRDLLGNGEEDVEEAASQLMPDDLVDQLVCRSHSAAEEVRSE